MKKVTKYKLPVIGLLLWAMSFTAQAQNKGEALDTLKMSLQECIDYALKNNVNVKNSSLDEEIAAAKVREIRGVGLPQISGSAGVQHYFKLRNSYFGSNSPFTATRQESIRLEDQNGQPIQAVSNVTNQAIPLTAAVPNAIDPKTIIVYPNIFQLPSTIDASVSASQILFNASYLVGLQAAKTYKELAQRSTSITRQQTATNVKKAYYQQQIGYERIKLFDVSIARLDSSIRQMKAMQANGFVEKLDVDRLEVSYNNLLTEYEKSLNFLLLSSLTLKFQMGMPLEQNVILKDDLNVLTPDTDYALKTDYDVNNRPEYMLLKTQRKANELDLKNNRAAALPSLVLSGTLGAFNSVKDFDFFSNKPFYVVNPSNPSASSVVNQSMYWSSYSFIQAGLNVPIFSGFQRSSKVQQSKLNLQKSENSLRNFEQTVNLQVQSAKVNLTNSKQSLKIQERNMDLAKNISTVVYKKYKAGVASNLEVTTAEASLKEAQINYFNALYDFLVSKTDYEQAAGLNNY